MTDEELVKRLREDQPVTQDMVSTMQCALQDDAADRIEELEATLAKVVEALGNIARQKKTAQIEAEGETEFSDFEGAYDMCIDVARATLAEIEGEKK
jgi:hypothetical protein